MYRIVKRILDFLVSLLGLIFISPVLLLLALGVKLDSKGPAIFRQVRLGKGGKPFEMLKFRSMVVGAEHTGTGVYSAEDDPRVTKFGKILRATGLDELPQLVNILIGEMSFIGPRPVLTYHPWRYEEYTEEQKKRFEVRPGVTGWAQVNGRKTLIWTERLKYDAEYVENLSFLFDLKILFLTFKAVLGQKKDNINKGATV